MQKLEDTKNSWKLVRPKEIVEVLQNLKKIVPTFANTTQKNRILPNFKFHKIDRWNLEAKLNSKWFACSTLDM